MSWFLVLPIALATAPGGTFTDSTVVPLEGISITGSRVPESVLRTPAALSVVTKNTLRSTRGISLLDGLARVPGVFSQSRGGGQDVRITIRGYGARGNGERSNAGNMRGIRVLTDGIPLTEPDGRTSLEFIDLGSADRIEVLRSNGSVVYGNASGGVVQLRTAFDFERPWIEYQERAGSFGYHREQGAAGIAMGSGRGTVSVFNSNFDGWRAHSRSTTTSIQSRFSAPLDDRTRLGVLADFVSNLNFFPGALTQAQLEADPEQANPTFVTRNERRFNRAGRLGFSLERGLEGNTSVSATLFAEPKSLQRSERNRFRDFNRYHIGGNLAVQHRTTFSSELYGTWTAGADDQFQDGAIQFYNLAPGGNRSTTVFQNKREGSNSAGGFVQAELTWSEQWAVRVAARYDNLWYLSEDRVTPRLNATKRFTQVTPKGSVARMFERHTIYASVGGGVEAPAFNEIDPPPPYDTLTSFNPFLEPMSSTSYEFGAKGEFAAQDSRFGRLSYDAALYWIDVRNEVVPFNGGAFFFTAGKSRRRGAELGLGWSPVDKLSFNGALTFSQNEYVEYQNELGDFDGNDVAGLPEALVNVEARYQLPAGLSVSGNLKHVGHYFADDANTAFVEGYVLYGALLEYAHAMPIGVMRAFVSGDNLTDEEHVSSVFINGISGQYFEPGLPQNWSAGLSLSIR
ncbi:MAG: TonB-dependent receptor [Candidatus Eisenbacteria bacterium]|uniref:TonB-dependent receptor n=1 Tax=Eiseniibacteriota bacterium TaxID=2212470 RepID=A0A849SLK6_UNCEI|nr:TonB-dependent receptor [Candidatus Eisenbacteria bacterium]